jgi:cytochrome P450
MVEATVEGDSSNKNRKLSNEEITSHAINFMLAGYETTANALSYISYLLALNPHVQEKLQEEVDKFYGENEVSALLWLLLIN